MQKFEFRKITSEDTDILAEMIKDEGFQKYYIPNTKMDLVLLNGEVIGTFSVVGSYIPEIQLAILPEHRKKGYAIDLTHQLVEELFKQGYPEVNLKIHKDNKASLNLAKKCGFYINWDNEPFNEENKEDMYYTLYKRNYSLDTKRKR